MPRREVSVYAKDDSRVFIVFLTKGNRTAFYHRDASNYWVREMLSTVFRLVAQERGSVLPNISSIGWSYTELEDN